MKTFSNYRSSHVTLFLLALVLTLLPASYVYAGPSKTKLTTPEKRFKVMPGCWFITDSDPEIALLDDTYVCVVGSESLARIGLPDSNFLIAAPIALKLKKGKKKKKRGLETIPVLGSRQKATFEVRVPSPNHEQFLEVLGPKGKFNAIFPGGSDFSFFNGTFIPKEGSVNEANFRATKIPSEIDTGSNMTMRVTKDGPLKLGGTTTFTISLINRGPQLLPEETIQMEFVFANAESVTVTKTTRMDNCTAITSPFKGATCDVGYLGLPKESTFGSVEVEVALPEESEVSEDLIVNLIVGVVNNSDFKILNEPEKNIKFTVKKPKSGGNTKKCPKGSEAKKVKTKLYDECFLPNGLGEAIACADPSLPLFVAVSQGFPGTPPTFRATCGKRSILCDALGLRYVAIVPNDDNFASYCAELPKHCKNAAEDRLCN